MDLDYFIIIIFSDNMEARARRLIMPKNPEEVAKPSIGKVILALGSLDCIRDILRKVWKIPKCEDNFFFYNTIV